jgi:hypothetical protein
MIYFLFLLTYIIGYLAGYLMGRAAHITSIIPMPPLSKIANDFAKKFKPAIKTGIIHNPTAEELYNRKLPPKVKEGREEMLKTLNNIPELAKAKQDLEAYNKRKSINWIKRG